MGGKLSQTEQSTQRRLSRTWRGSEVVLSLRIFMCGTEMSYLSPSHLTDWSIKGESIIQTKTVSCLALSKESFCSVPSGMQKISLNL